MKNIKNTILLGLLLLTSLMTNASAEPGKLWVSTYSDALGIDLQDFPQPHVVSGGYEIAIDQASGNVWTYDGLSLLSYKSDGSSLGQYPINLYGANSHIVVDSDLNRLWLTLEDNLYIFDLNGQQLKQIPLDYNNFKLQLDKNNNLLYLSDDLNIHVFDLTGEFQYTVDLQGNASLRAFSVDSYTNTLLVLADDKILRFDAAGLLVSEAIDENVGCYHNLSVDAFGGFWTANYDRVYHYSADNGYDFNTIGFKNPNDEWDIGSILTIVAEPETNSIWLGSYYDVKHINILGEELYSLNTYYFEGAERQIFKMKMYYGNGDSTPNTRPEIEFTSPANNAVFQDTAPTLQLSFSAGQETIDATSLLFELNQVPTQLSCVTTSLSATCDFSVYPGVGSYELTAVISNNIGEQSIATTLNFEIGANIAPEFTTTPLLNVIAGELYAYDVNASDVNGDSITYALTEAPSTMQIDTVSGLLIWQTLTTDVGSIDVTVTATDNFGTSVNQSFIIIVAQPLLFIPELTGETQNDAQQIITDAGLLVGAVTSEFSDSVDQGLVISQAPLAGTETELSAEVSLVISAGVETTVVPDVNNANVSDIEQILAGASLILGDSTSVFSSTVAVGRIISQSPQAGEQVVIGSAVDVIVSLGILPINVPSVVGQQQASAETLIVSSGLTIGAITNISHETIVAGNVISQNPPAGTSVVTGSAVSIVVSTGPAPVSVPNVVGQTQSAAATLLVSGDLIVGDVTTISSETIIAGNIISQNPSAGTSVVTGSAVSIVVSTGPAPVSVPNVVGQTQSAAVTLLISGDLIVGDVTTISSETIVAGNVISQNPPAGTSVVTGSAVSIVISTGPAPVSVPNVVGQTQSAAATLLISGDLIVGDVTTISSETIVAGNVISQNPPAGTSVVTGSAVSIVVSTGPAPVSVPNVVGQTQSAATTLLVSGDLIVGDVTTISSETIVAGNIISQTPQAGTSVVTGSAVSIVVSTGPAPVSVPSVIGLPQASAETDIVSSGLIVGIVTSTSSETIEVGSVITQSPTAGSSIFVGGSVDLVISTGPVPVIVPNLVDQPQNSAEILLTSGNLIVGTVTTASSETTQLGNVISQNPAAGLSVENGSAVSIVVSSGPAPVTVPNVVGQQQGTAEALLISSNLIVGSISNASSDTIAVGDVISQNPIAGTIIANGGAVNLVVSSGPATVNVPNVVGQTQSAAESLLISSDLIVGGVSTENSETVTAGNIISQNPISGTSVVNGSAINLIVSSGPAVIVVLTSPLDVSVVANPQIINVGEVTTVTVIGEGGNGALNVSLTVNGLPVSLDVNGQVSLNGDAPGSYNLVASVFDSGESLTSTTYFSVRDPADNSGPVAIISSPSSPTEVTEPIDIMGTASDINLAEYILAYSPKGQNNWVTWHTGSESITNGVLGRFDPTTIANGVYDILLQVVDVNGATTSTSITFEVVGDFKIGNFSFTIEDLSIPVSGIPIKINRTYDTRRKADDLDFGFGWSIDYQDVKIEENVVLGSNWTTTSTGGFIPTVCVQPVGRHTVSISLPDGNVEKFDMDVTPKCNAITVQRYVDPVFNARSGTDSTLSAQNIGQLYMDGSRLLDTGTFDSYDPVKYTLTTKQGMVYELNKNFGIESVTDRVGNVLSYSRNGIIHSSGKSILFDRDNQGRITTITDPMGNEINYEYSSRGDLSAVTDSLNNSTRYTYNRTHGLGDIIDPLGRRVSRNIYNEEGKLIAIEDADGERISVDSNADDLTETVTDKLGNVSVLQYDVEGNLLSEVGPMGKTTTFSYDGSGNALTETNALGDVTTRTYDISGDILSELDALGNTASKTNDLFGQLRSRTDAMGNVTQYTYSSNGSPLTTVDADGNVTTFAYDASGNLLRQTDAQGNVTTNAYDVSGNKTRITDALGNQTNMTYDENGNQLSTSLTRINQAGESEVITYIASFDTLGRETESIDYLGNIRETEFDELGNVAVNVDALGRRTEYTYDFEGKLLSTIYADGTTEEVSYDAKGMKTQSADRAGRLTNYTYNALSQLIETQTPDGLRSQNEYDLESRLLASINPSGARISYVYDAVGNVTRVTDAFGNVTTHTYNENKKRISSTDSEGNTTLFTYDAFGKNVLTTFSDSTTIENEYDSMGNNVAVIDQLGRRTTYIYNALGSLLSIVDAKGNPTSFTYNERNNKTSETDANGNVTRWAYDAMGRKLSRELPEGEIETFTYDREGNLLTHTDFNSNSVQFTYDENNQLRRKVYADSSQVTYTYTSDQQLESVTDSRGETRSSYDEFGRLLRVDQPGNNFIAYSYGVEGRVSTMTQPAGVTAYEYDVMGRLTQVTDIDGNITVYTYNSINKLEIAFLANGTQKVFSYDALQRLIRIQYLRNGVTELVSFEYTLDDAGKRTNVTEVVNSVVRTIAYEYDDIDLLTTESINDSVSGAQVISYTHDASGNALTRSIDGQNMTYQYNSNDQLLSEGVIDYQYDDNGNMLSKDDAGNVTTYNYDYENHLTNVTGSSSIASYTYDYQGLRIASNLNGVQTTYLFDERFENAQVVEEQNNSGDLIVSYARGYGLISQRRGSETQYYYANAIGSVSALANNDANITDTYQYTGYGEVVSNTGTSENTYRYAGEHLDSVQNNYYLRARFYNPSNGRFINMDNFEGVDAAPLSLNKYLYAHANPIMNTDPSGNFIGSMMGGFMSLSLRGRSFSGYGAFLLRARSIAFFSRARSAAANCARAGIRAIATSRRSRHPCGRINANILFVGQDNPENTKHIVEAMSYGQPAFLKYRGGRFNPLSRGWYRNAAACSGRSSTMDCDEYPFYSTRQHSSRASLKVIPKWDNRSAGGKLGGFYRACKIYKEYRKRPTSLLTFFAVVPTNGITFRKCANVRGR